MLNKNGFSNSLGRNIKRGDIFFADLGENNIGSEQSGKRPVIIIQNDADKKVELVFDGKYSGFKSFKERVLL